ncbi:MAG: M1 family aminopeptidase [Flavobacteriales bacterium]
MNKLSTAFLAIALGIPGFYVSAQAPYKNVLADIAKAEKNAHQHKISPERRSVGALYNITYHKCNWNINPAANFISGNILTHFQPLQVALDSLCFNLSDSLTVDSVKYHGNTIAFNHTADIVTVFFPSGIPVAVLDSVTVYYQGIPPATGLGSFVQDVHSGIPIIWTLSEPYGASDWWPCKNDLTDKADSIDIYIKVPAGNKAASNGVLVSSVPSGGNITHHWKHRHAIATYLVALAVTNYVEYSYYVPFAATNVEMLNYVYPEDSAVVVPQIGGNIAVMQLFDTLFGVYPFVDEKYGHAQFNWGGGMEHQTMSFVGDFGHELLAHELAHQWFGDYITCGSWEDIWLNEGFATYLSGLTYEHMFAGFYWPFFKSFKRADVTSQPDGSVWVDDTTDVNRIFDSRLTYAKGCMILHQLRWVIGDSAFFAAINNYLNDPLLAHGFARTSHLKAHFEASSGTNLTWYFNDWFTGQGFPSFQVNWVQTGSNVTIIVNQTQSHISVPFFELPIPVKLIGATQDTTLRLDFASQGQVYNVSIPFTATSMEFDPEIWLISNSNLVTSTPEIEPEKEISVFPNPAENSIQIKGITEKHFSVIMFDVSGKTVLQSNDMSVISISQLEKGLYVMKVTEGAKKYSFRIEKK